MADWKRARKTLSSSLDLQQEQAFGEKGALWCAAAPTAPNPCEDMYNCAYNHYLVQQHLYADFLLREYNVKVERMYLVQCHPYLGQTGQDLNVAELPHMPELASKILQAFEAGWKTRLSQFSVLTQ